MEYLPLNPYRTIQKVINSSYHTIFASGTLQPREEFDYLAEISKQAHSAEVEEESKYSYVNSFSCDHIIKSSQIKIVPIDSYESQKFTFNFSN